MKSQAANVLQQITAANRKARSWTATRNRLIIEAHQSGAGLREIASACGLSHMTIKRIIQRETP